MTLAVRRAKSFVAALQLALLCLASGACAQDPTRVSQSAGNTVLQLPSRLFGVWVPYSKSFEQLGELRLTAETISWGGCMYEEYRVLRADEEQKSYVVELVHSPPCKIEVSAPLLMFEFSDRALKFSDRGLEVSICHEPAQLERPPGRRSCSRGVLTKKDK